MLSSPEQATESTENPKPKRVPPGKPWQPGQSGNPGGRKKQQYSLTQLAREHTREALETMVAIMKDKRIAPGTRLTAAEHVLDRGHGKAPTFSLQQISMHSSARGLSDQELLAVIAAQDTVVELQALPSPTVGEGQD